MEPSIIGRVERSKVIERIEALENDIRSLHEDFRKFELNQGDGLTGLSFRERVTISRCIHAAGESLYAARFLIPNQ